MLSSPISPWFKPLPNPPSCPPPRPSIAPPPSCGGPEPTPCFAADEFFAARISNPHTRRAYARIVGRFLAWCEEQGIELRQVTPGLAGRFIEELPGSDPTRNQALAALRHFFDTLVIRHAVALNPFSSVRGQEALRRWTARPPSSTIRAGAGFASPPWTSLVSWDCGIGPCWEC